MNNMHLNSNLKMGNIPNNNIPNPHSHSHPPPQHLPQHLPQHPTQHPPITSIPNSNNIQPRPNLQTNIPNIPNIPPNQPPHPHPHSKNPRLNTYSYY